MISVISSIEMTSPLVSNVRLIEIDVLVILMLVRLTKRDAQETVIAHSIEVTKSHLIEIVRLIEITDVQTLKVAKETLIAKIDDQKIVRSTKIGDHVIFKKETLIVPIGEIVSRIINQLLLEQKVNAAKEYLKWIEVANLLKISILR